MKKNFRKQSIRQPSRMQRRESGAVFFHELSPEARQGIKVVVVLMITLVSVLSLFELAGAVGVGIQRALSVLFGYTRYFVPLFILLFGIFFIRRVPLMGHVIQITGLAFLILSFTALWHLSFPLEEQYMSAVAGRGGGVVGFFLSFSLESILQFWGALIVILSIFIISFLILVNSSIDDMIARCKAAGTFCVSLCSFFARMPKGVARDRRRGAAPSAQEPEPTQGAGESPDFSRRTVALKEKHEEEEDAEPVYEGKKEEEMEIIKPPKRKTVIQIPLDLLNGKSHQPTSGDIKANKLIIQKTLENFGIAVEMGEVNVGPTVTQFTLKPAEGIKLAAITGLHNDLALSLAAHPIRIEAPIPGRALVGIEVPNQKVAIVTLRELLESDAFKSRKDSLTLALGKDVAGQVRLSSVLKMPHLLIAGSTGSGKTVCINTVITTLLYQNSPETLRFILVDPKRVELSCYNDIPHLLTPVVTDVKKTLNVLRWAIGEMERRFDVLAKAGKRDLISYNAWSEEKIPYIIIVIDELADIMATVGAEAESLIIRLAQMARAVGIHLILATQRPSVDVITGLIKANITSRIAFAVASQMDSRTILDTSGAERLVGRGDMLFVSADLSKPVRLQGAFLSDAEIERVVACLKESGEPSYQAAVTERVSAGDGAGGGFGSDEEDDLLPEAREIILQAQKASASLLQRRLRIGYARAARILDLLENEGFIGPGDGAKPRKVIGHSFDESADDLGPQQTEEEKDDAIDRGIY
ncbi:MAG: DNA translocase FtsK 4TM domain-containing protein [Candidatus Uhrbacteria bacterium]|nr:DNA translocase FtsK 4TM domain-containing protein [Candidatus Uhrbacteria bacterium]